MNLSSVITAAAGNPIPDGSGSWASSVVDYLYNRTIYGICWSGRKVFMAPTGPDPINAIYRNTVSGDPQYWDRVALPTDSPAFTNVFAKNNVVIAYGVSGFPADAYQKKMAVSTNGGSSYTLVSLPIYVTGNTAQKIGYLNGVFTMLSLSGVGVVYTSVDGVNWGYGGNIIGYTNAANRTVLPIITVGANAFATITDDTLGTTYVLRTTNAVNWTVISNVPKFSIYSGIVWNGSVFCMVMQNGEIGLSPDGVTWTYNSNLQSVFSGVSAPESVIYDNRYFFVFGSHGYFATSEDGVTWTLRTSLRSAVSSAAGVRSAVWDGENIWAVVDTFGSYDGFTMAVTS